MSKKKIIPPKHLSEKSQKLWKDLVRDWNFHPLQLEILQCGLENLDLARVCMGKIYKEGLVVQVGKGSKPHPLLRTLKEAKMIFLRSMMQLKFDTEFEDRIRKEVSHYEQENLS